MMRRCASSKTSSRDSEVGGAEARRQTWHHIELDRQLWTELASYDLVAKERRAHLNKVAFPDFNHPDVDAALKAGK